MNAFGKKTFALLVSFMVAVPASIGLIIRFASSSESLLTWSPPPPSLVRNSSFLVLNCAMFTKSPMWGLYDDGADCSANSTHVKFGAWVNTSNMCAAGEHVERFVSKFYYISLDLDVIRIDSIVPYELTSIIRSVEQDPTTDNNGVFHDTFSNISITGITPLLSEQQLYNIFFKFTSEAHNGKTAICYDYTCVSVMFDYLLRSCTYIDYNILARIPPPSLPPSSPPLSPPPLSPPPRFPSMPFMQKLDACDSSTNRSQFLQVQMSFSRCFTECLLRIYCLYAIIVDIGIRNTYGYEDSTFECSMMDSCNPEYMNPNVPYQLFKKIHAPPSIPPLSPTPE